MTKINLINLFIALFMIPSALADVRNVKTVKNPRPKGHWITDEARILKPETFSSLDRKLNELSQKTTAEFAVVILKTVGDGSPKEFATTLFNYWHIGKKQNSNGLLMLMVMDQRRVEFETGYGLEGPLPDIALSRILHNLVVPQFQKNDFGAGIEAAVGTIVQILNGNDVIREIYVRDAKPPHDPVLDLMWGVLALGLCMLGFYFLRLMILLLISKDPFLTYSKMGNGWLWLGIIGLLMISVFAFVWQDPKFEWPLLAGADGAAVGFLVFLQTSVRKFLRHRKRICNKCSKPMRFLSEADEDAYLNKRQLFEESIESINYDVWICEGCKNHRIDGFDGRLASKFSICAACETRADKLIADERVVAPTTISAGEGEKTFECLSCHKVRKERYAIAQLTDNSDSSSSSGGSGFGSFSSSSSSGSFGGGSSGGGGSGASW